MALTSSPSRCTLGRAGRFVVSLPGIALRGCRVEAVADGAEACSDFPWLEAAGAEGSAFTCRNRLGRWRLEVHPAAGDGLAIHLTGRLARGCDRLQLRPLVCPRVAADHVLEHGRRMGGCHSLVTAELEQERAFASSFNWSN